MLKNASLSVRGSVTALITPFDKSGAFDEKTFTRLIERQIEAGSHGLVPVGTTGESPVLDCETHIRAIRVTVEAARGKIPVIAGTGANSFDEALTLTLAAQEAGADAALIVAPYYNKPSQAGMIAHFKALHDATDIPIILYNVPGRTVADLLPETVAELAKLPRIIGIKDATGKIERISAQRALCGEDFIILSGEDGCALAAVAHGAVGCISVTANVAPRLCAEFQDALGKSDFKKALAYQDMLFPLHEAMFCEPSPAPAKFALSRLGLCENVLRLPLVPATEKAEKQILAAMKHAGLI